MPLCCSAMRLVRYVEDQVFTSVNDCVFSNEFLFLFLLFSIEPILPLTD